MRFLIQFSFRFRNQFNLKFNVLEQSKEIVEPTSCSWGLRILKERSSFIENNIDTDEDLVHNEEYIFNLPRQNFGHDDTPYTKKSVNSNSFLAHDHCKTPDSNKENDKECDMNMSSSEPDVTLLCKTNHTSKLNALQKRNIQEIDDKETNETKIKNKTLSDDPKITEGLSSAPKNKFIPTQNQQGLTDNNGQNNKMFTVIGDDKGSNSESNKKQSNKTEIQRNLASSYSKESKTSYNKMPRSRGMGVTRKVTEDYVVSLLALN